MTSSCGPSEARGRSHARTVLCVASTGGHFVQLMQILSGLEGCDVHVVTTYDGDRTASDPWDHYTVPDSSRWSRWSVVRSAVRLTILIWRLRPAVLVTTGAAPGYLALRIARFFGARTLWIDSAANVDEVSLAGRMAHAHADEFLVQWPHIAEDGWGRFEGRVI
jgi:UDP-N-acetylglucosamine:LPS N-acetylglucosamine transferase